MSQGQSASESLESAETLTKATVGEPEVLEGDAEVPAASMAVWPPRPLRRSATWRLFVSKRDGQF
jgi:hypothetical protein